MLNSGLLRNAGRSLYLIFFKKQEVNSMVQHAVDDIIMQENDDKNKV